MSKLYECIKERKTSSVPIWFMRQAGRYLPEFREIRLHNQDFIKLCLTPELVEDITLQPIKRFNLDATIIFSDILMVPYGLGQFVEFKKGYGPSLGNFNLDQILKINKESFVKKLSPVYSSITKVKKKTKKESLIGFAGAPWTLLVYMINKQSPKKDFNFNSIIKDKELTQKLLKKLQESVCWHVQKQIEAGANIIQIFDSWAGLLPQKEIPDYCFEPTKKIVEYIKSLKIPVICFPKGIGKNYENFCSDVEPNCISIDPSIDPEWMREKSKGIAIQGGMDPKILLSDKNDIKKTVQKYLDVFSGYPYIFNLGHGVLPETNPEIIKHIVEIIRGKNGKT